MNKDKLLHIIRKDLLELNEMTSDLVGKKILSTHEIEFALSKSRIVLQEFEFLKELNASFSEETAVSSEPEISVSDNQQKAEHINESVAEEKSDFLIKREVDVEEKNGELIVPDLNDNRNLQMDSETETPEISNSSIEPDEPVVEEIGDAKKIVGETFIKGKSLNEILTDTYKLDQKLASSPIEKLESGIGLNDRFQFIRELFDNDANLFQQVVQQIDKMDSLNDAVSYLSGNYQWKKNDTSIKFAQLVKRRFTN